MSYKMPQLTTIARTFQELCHLGLQRLDISKTLSLVLCNDLQGLVVGPVNAQSGGLVGIGSRACSSVDGERASRLKVE